MNVRSFPHTETATGIKRFQEDRGFGKWFNALYEVVKTRYSCQPDQEIEPSSSERSFDDPDDNEEQKCKLFVPLKNKRKSVAAKEKLDMTTTT